MISPVFRRYGGWMVLIAGLLSYAFVLAMTVVTWGWSWPSLVLFGSLALIAVGLHLLGVAE